MKPLIYDIETLKKIFCIVYLIPGEPLRRFEISKWRNDLYALIKFIEEHQDYYWVGYNNLRFDAQVIEWIIRNYENWYDKTGEEICEMIHQKASDIIDDANYEVFAEYREHELTLKQIDLFKINHYDNKNRMVSLKRLEFEMDMEDIEEMPIDPGADNLDREQCVNIIKYCMNDVKATYQFYLVTIGETDHPLYRENNQIQLRLDIEEEFGIPCLNYSDTKIGDEMIKKFYCQEKKISYSQLPKKGFFRKNIEIKNCIAGYVKFQTKELQQFLRQIKTQSLGVQDDFKEEIKFYGNVYSFMKGGLHTENRPEIFEQSEDYFIIDWDVSSYYPATIINNKRYPAHLGLEFLEGYIQMFEKRLKLKPLSKTSKKIKGIVNALKLAVNSVYGKSSDMQSWMYDRQLTMFTTITGELSLMMLIEAYELAGIHIISANTDGITAIVHKDKLSKMEEINAWWCEITKYELERTDYEKIIFSTVNDYIAIKKGYNEAPANKKADYIKKKGDFLTDFELHKNKSARVVPIALENYFVKGIPIEDTIKNHTNIYDFALRQKSSKDFHYEGIVSISDVVPSNAFVAEKIKNEWTKGTWWDQKEYWYQIEGQHPNDHWGGYSHQEMIKKIVFDFRAASSKRNIYHKLIRYYISNTGEKLLKIKNPECMSNAAPISQVEAGEWMATVCNHLTKKHPLDNINHKYYIQRANRIVHKIQTNGKKIKEEDPNQLKLF